MIWSLHTITLTVLPLAPSSAAVLHFLSAPYDQSANSSETALSQRFEEIAQ